MLNRRLFTAKRVKQLAQVILLFLPAWITDGFFYSAHAPCSAWDKIYIDPAHAGDVSSEVEAMAYEVAQTKLRSRQQRS
jgi:hypothetical protein